MDVEKERAEAREREKKESLKFDNEQQVKLALRYGKKIGLTPDDAVLCWTRKYGGLWRDQPGHSYKE